MASTQPSSNEGGQTAPRSSAPTLTQTAHVPFNTLPQQAVLRLRGASTETEELEDDGEGGTRRKSRIQWAEGVIDNEGLGRKKSKVCCIYHAPKGIDESSDESSSDSDDSDSSGADDGGARPARGGGKKDCEGNGHGHGHEGHGHSHGVGKGKGRKRSPNAYEKMPKPKAGGGVVEKN